MNSTPKKRLAFNYAPPSNFHAISFEETKRIRRGGSYSAKKKDLRFKARPASINSLAGRIATCRKVIPAVYFWCVYPTLNNGLCQHFDENGEVINIIRTSLREPKPRIVYHGETGNLFNRVDSYIGDICELYEFKIGGSRDHQLYLRKKVEVDLDGVDNAMMLKLYRNLGDSPVLSIYAKLESRHVAYESVILNHFNFLANVKNNREICKIPNRFTSASCLLELTASMYRDIENLSRGFLKKKQVNQVAKTNVTYKYKRPATKIANIKNNYNFTTYAFGSICSSAKQSKNKKTKK